MPPRPPPWLLAAPARLVARSRPTAKTATSWLSSSAPSAASATPPPPPSAGQTESPRFTNPLKQQVTPTMAEAAVRRAAKAKQDASSDPTILSLVRETEELVQEELKTMFTEIHSQLDATANGHRMPNRELEAAAKFYFDGQGKAVRPSIAMTMGHAYNCHVGDGRGPEEAKKVLDQQRKVAVIAEMIHTASLVHDDILDHAETRRGKPSLNATWDDTLGVWTGNYILGVSSRIMAQMRHDRVLVILSRVLADLVRGEFEQAQHLGHGQEKKRFDLYMSKTYLKTASLIANSCEAVAVLSGAADAEVAGATEYGRNLGVAFQLVDDILDFEQSSEHLGKPAGADLELGLATAPVLFAAEADPELAAMVDRGFADEGDARRAYEIVRRSDGLEKTRRLAEEHCQRAVSAIDFLRDSQYKWALIARTEKVLKRNK